MLRAAVTATPLHPRLHVHVQLDFTRPFYNDTRGDSSPGLMKDASSSSKRKIGERKTGKYILRCKSIRAVLHLQHALHDV